MAISLGGYYAPRAASLEPRYAACIAWGAQWDYYDVWKRRFELLDSGKVPSLSVPPEHLMWVFGVDSREAAMKKLEGFRLDGIVQKMKCPFLLLHGAGDEQIPLPIAETMFRRGRLEAEDAEGVHPRGRRLPPLPGRRRDHRRALHVGLGRGRVEAGDVIALSGNFGLSASPWRPARAAASCSTAMLVLAIRACVAGARMPEAIRIVRPRHVRGRQRLARMTP